MASASRAAYSTEELIWNLTWRQALATIEFWVEFEIRPLTHRVNAILPSTDMVGDEKIITDYGTLDVRKCMTGSIGRHSG